MKRQKEEIIINPPRPAWNLMSFVFALMPLTMISIATIYMYPLKKITDLLDSIFIIIYILFFISFFLLYKLKNERIVAILKDSNQMEIRKKYEIMAAYNIDDIKGFISKHVKYIGDYKYYVLLENHDGNTETLFSAESLPKSMLLSRKQWNKFTERLALATEKSYRLERWREDGNGHLSLIPAGDRTNMKYRLLTFLPYLVILAGALFTRYFEELWYSFIITTICSIALSLGLAFAFAEDKVKSKDIVILMGAIFTLILRFSMSYFFVLLLVYGFDFKKIIELF